MSFEIPPHMYGVAAAFGNARITGQNLEKVNSEIAELRRQLIEASQLGKDVPCPYCAQLIARQALICNYCQGALSIGSPEAIRGAILINPALAIHTEEAHLKLVQVVQSIDDEFRKQAEALAESERLAEQERRRIEQEKQRAERERLDRERQEIELAEAVRLAAEKEKADLEAARLAAMNPFFRQYHRHKFLSVVTVLLLLGAPWWIPAASQQYQIQVEKNKQAALEQQRQEVQAKQIAAEKAKEAKLKLLQDAKRCGKYSFGSDSFSWVSNVRDVDGQPITNNMIANPYQIYFFNEKLNELAGALYWTVYSSYLYAFDRSDGHQLGKTFDISKHGWRNVKWSNVEWSYAETSEGNPASPTYASRLKYSFEVKCNAIIAQSRK